MTPEERAKEIYWKYTEFEDLTTEEAKKCCNIALDLVINEADDDVKDYWREVKAIINRRGL
jgi:hypothetical protein